MLGGGGSFLCPEAIPKVARHRYDHLEGVSPGMKPRGTKDFGTQSSCNWFNDVAQSCSNFSEATGECGDVFLMRPLMLHSASLNPLRKVRIITSPPIILKEPISFNRQNGEYTMVEQTTLRALGVDSLPGWKSQRLGNGLLQGSERHKLRMEGKSGRSRKVSLIQPFA